MIKGDLYVVNCEFSMIFIWIIHERLDIYMWSRIWHEQCCTLMVGNQEA